MVWFMRRADTSGATGDFDKSVAVIPFALVAGDTASADLAEAIADAVVRTLSDAPGLRLADGLATARFAGATATVQEIGTALDVSTVLAGTVGRAGDRVRVTAELSNARNGIVLWQQKYDRDARTTGTIADDIARAIAAQMQVTLTANGATRR